MEGARRTTGLALILQGGGLREGGFSPSCFRPFDASNAIKVGAECRPQRLRGRDWQLNAYHLKIGFTSVFRGRDQIGITGEKHNSINAPISRYGSDV